MDIRQRLAIFYERLKAAPPAKNAEEAFALICRVLEDVENEICPVPPTNPAPRVFDGRMYAPQSDNIKVREDGSIWVKTQRHRIAIQADGSFVIYHVVEQKRLVEEFRKGGEKP
jgi:hypothetical protein